jgi:hypothetical protein
MVPLLLLLTVISSYRLAGFSSELDIISRLNVNEVFSVFLPVITCGLYMLALCTLHFGLNSSLERAIKQFNASNKGIDATSMLVQSGLSAGGFSMSFIILALVAGGLSMISQSSDYDVLGYLELIIATLGGMTFIIGLLSKHTMITAGFIVYTDGEKNE